MLSYIPCLYPDEIIFSYLSRYHSWSMNKAEKITRCQFYNQKFISINTEFPFGLSDIWKQMALYNPPPLEDIIIKHSFYIFCKNMRGEDKIQNIDDTLFNGIRRYLVNVNTKEYFQFCTECLEEDYTTYGESYWRMTFQLPTVLVCLKHKRLLCNSKTSFTTRELSHVNRETCDSTGIPMNVTKKTFLHLQRIAQQSILISQEEFGYNESKREINYFNYLNKNGFLSNKGKILTEKIIKQLIKFYGIELIRILDIDLQRIERCLEKFFWLKSLREKEQLILILFLAKDFKEFCQSPSIPDYQNNSNSCLNPFCIVYNQEVAIENIEFYEHYFGVRIEYNCCCGFHYEMKVHDLYKNKVSTEIKEYGKSWSNVLFALIYIKDMPLLKISNKLKCSEFDIEDHMLNNINIDSRLLNNKHHIRNEWLRVLDESPDTNFYEIKQKNFKVYAWLYNFDFTWFYHNNPRYHYNRVKKNDLFWKKRDKDLKIYLKNYTITLLNQGYPLKEIIKKAYSKSGRLQLDKELSHLPKVSEYLRRLSKKHPQNLRFYTMF